MENTQRGPKYGVLINLVILAMIAGFGLILIGQMQSQANAAISTFDAVERPRFDTACGTHGGRFARMSGRNADKSWNIVCADGANLVVTR